MSGGFRVPLRRSARARPTNIDGYSLGLYPGSQPKHHQPQQNRCGAPQAPQDKTTAGSRGGKERSEPGQVDRLRRLGHGIKLLGDRLRPGSYHKDGAGALLQVYHFLSSPPQDRISGSLAFQPQGGEPVRSCWLLSSPWDKGGQEVDAPILSSWWWLVKGPSGEGLWIPAFTGLSGLSGEGGESTGYGRAGWNAPKLTRPGLFKPSSRQDEEKPETWTMPLLPLVCAKGQQGQKGVLHGAAHGGEPVKTPLPAASHGALDNESPSLINRGTTVIRQGAPTAGQVFSCRLIALT